jgi:hypothetical protein
MVNRLRDKGRSLRLNVDIVKELGSATVWPQGA